MNRHLLLALVFALLALGVYKIPVIKDGCGNVFVGPGKYCVHVKGIDICVYNSPGLCVALHKICGVNKLYVTDPTMFCTEEDLR